MGRYIYLYKESLGWSTWRHAGDLYSLGKCSKVRKYAKLHAPENFFFGAVSVHQIEEKVVALDQPMRLVWDLNDFVGFVLAQKLAQLRSQFLLSVAAAAPSLVTQKRHRRVVTSLNATSVTSTPFKNAKLRSTWWCEVRQDHQNGAHLKGLFKVYCTYMREIAQQVQTVWL